MKTQINFVVSLSMLYCLSISSAYSQSRLENALYKADPRMLREFQQSVPKLEQSGINLNNLKDFRNITGEMDNMERTVSEKASKNASALSAIRSDLRDPNLKKETKQPPQDFHLPVFRGNNATFVTINPQLRGLDAPPGGLPQSLTINTNDAPDTVISWYEASLRREGWQVNSSKSASPNRSFASASFDCTKGVWKGAVQIAGTTSKRGSQTSVSLVEIPPMTN